MGKAKKRLISISAIIIVILLLGLSYFYWGTYSEGSRSGVVMKISKSGTVFKTYEGQLNLQGFGGVSSGNQFSQVWEFSVESDRKDIAEKLQNASLEGERVELVYIERFSQFPWRGNTKYFIRDVVEKE